MPHSNNWLNYFLLSSTWVRPNKLTASPERAKIEFMITSTWDISLQSLIKEVEKQSKAWVWGWIQSEFMITSTWDLTFQSLRGAFRQKKTEKVGLLDQPADPPLPVIWSKKNGKKIQCLFCILDYSEQFNFSWKFTIFWVFLGWDRGTPPLAWELAQLFSFFFCPAWR